MFSFRRDKVGFFFGLALLVVSGGTFIATLVLLIVGACLGDFTMFLWPIRWVLAGSWIGCIVIVLGRVYILNWQMHQWRQTPADSPQQPETPAIAPVLMAEAEIARARADAERYRAVKAIGVATVLGVVSALTIVSFLAASVRDLPGAAPVQIVAWSVGGGVILVVVILCAIMLRGRGPRPPFPASQPQEPASTGVQQHSAPR
jgi:hypothetical protein